MLTQARVAPAIPVGRLRARHLGDRRGRPRLGLNPPFAHRATLQVIPQPPVGLSNQSQEHGL
ncbi:MAG TPA: hypothetical protein P5032_16360 [Candidatus Competibacter sp.]|nr:hypothetical protein [Candidatus Competibacter sp.]